MTIFRFGHFKKKKKTLNNFSLNFGTRDNKLNLDNFTLDLP